MYETFYERQWTLNVFILLPQVLIIHYLVSIDIILGKWGNYSNYDTRHTLIQSMQGK